jgi:hypothetical protein
MEQRLEVKMRENGETATKQHKEIQVEIQKDINTIDSRVASLEQWKWWLMGAAATVGVVLGVVMDLAKHFVK